MDISLDQLWNEALGHLQVQLSRPTFEAWIKTARPESLVDNRLTISTPSEWARGWLQKHYASTITEVVQRVAGIPLQVEFSVSPHALVEEEPPAKAISPTLPRAGSLPASPTLGLEVGGSLPMRAPDLNPKYSFSRFVVGPNNRMAHAAALAVADKPGRAYNPLFLCGGVGLGKTHLMQAIGHYQLEANPQAKVFYVSTERFTNDLID
ncbi:DnaA/Hda family protein, partial [Synechococcus sp. H55.2]